jgi:pimeloyl-ACP methyl ester carboxylesterase
MAEPTPSLSWTRPSDALAKGCRSGTVRRGRRNVHFVIVSSEVCEAHLEKEHDSLDSFAAAGALMLLFPPLGTAMSFIGSLEFVAAAAAVGLIVLAVDRPGIDGTSASPRRWLHCAGTRLATHSADIACVLRVLGVKARVRLIGVCAGTPFALSFMSSHPEQCDASHLTLVTPWINGECPHNQRIVCKAAAGGFGPHALIGNILILLNLGRIRQIRRASSDEQVVRIATSFSASERAKVERAMELDETMASRIAGAVRSRIATISLGGFAGDIAVCLAPAPTLGGASSSACRTSSSRALSSACHAPPEACQVPGRGTDGGADEPPPRVARATVLAACQDALVPFAATSFLCSRLQGEGWEVELVACLKSTHEGVHYLRAKQWLQVAGSRGKDLGETAGEHVIGGARTRTLAALKWDAMAEKAEVEEARKLSRRAYSRC